MERVICLVLGYAFGLFQTAYIYGRLNHIDIREYGSGNAGTTNALRVLGKKAGIITYIGDMLKAVIAGLLVRVIFGNADILQILLLFTGLGVVLGHNFPFYMGFKGGKGIAASSGVILAFGDWKLIVLAFLTFVIVTFITRYVSLGSLFMMGGFLVELIVFDQLGMLQIASNQRIEAYILGFLLAGLAFYKHKDNIVRLVKGTERKLGQKKEV